MANTKKSTTKKKPASGTAAKKAAPKKKTAKKAAPKKQTPAEQPLFRKKTIAERTADGKTNRPAPRKEQKRHPAVVEDEEEGHSRGPAIAIASCVVVGVVALIIFFVLLAQGGLFAKSNMVEVPSLKLPENWIAGTVGAGDA